MKTATRIFSLFTFALLFNSCAFHSGVMTGSAALSDANFKVVDYAIGTSETFKVFGLGGVATDALVLEAKRNLYKNYPLENGQALANVSVDFKRSFFPIVSINKVVISADIVDFNEDAIVKSKNTEFPIKLDNERENDLRLSSEMVYFEKHGELKLGKIVGYGETKVKVMLHSDLNRLRIKRLPIRKLFFKNKNDAVIKTDFNIGDQISYVDETNKENSEIADVMLFGTIVGLGQKAAIIEDIIENVPMLFIVEYDKISIKE